jgi:hypothetical protein
LFAIPLRAKGVSRDWARVCHLLSCTLDSVLNQTDPHFSVALMCHDVPDLPQLKDPRVTVLTCHAPLPRDLQEQMRDKGLKKRMALAHLHQLGGGFLMLVDSDDLVSNRLVAHVRARKPRFGLLIDAGWEFDVSTRRLARAARFNRVCGSSAIFRFTPDELPADAAQTTTTLSDKFDSHRLWRETAATLHRPFDQVDFRAAVYTINNQENHSVLTGNIGWRRHLLRLLTRSHRPTDAEVQEFAMAGLLQAG